jgi:serine/threonine-protein kinase
MTADRRTIAGKYELVEVAGRGGMSTVWRAEQQGHGSFRRTVAAKQLASHLAWDPLYRDMFHEEARIGAELRDTNIAQIYDFVSDDGELFLIMEWIEGIELATYVDYIHGVARRATRWEMMVGAAIGMLRGLAAAHERVDREGKRRPIIHRDVSPHNVVINEIGTARLIDFGLSLAHDRSGEKTKPGIVKGKIAYLAPEVVRGERATPASDQFSAGVTLWEALAGRRLFVGDTPYETLREIADAKVTPLGKVRTELPPDLYVVVHRALAPDPRERFPSVRELANELGSILADRSQWRDTYELLGHTVREAREALALGHRTQRAAARVPTDEQESALIELDATDVEEAGVSELWAF